ncbi:CoA transferase [Nonomuraea mangrovi]|uniref:CoA transferase n=1 Tax=Nonomuraea mangrovi TaxID=2316207 RepID=A0ABW4T2E2_9ACTN
MIEAFAEGMVRDLGLQAGVELPRVRVTDDGSRLPSPYPVEVAAAVSVGAATAAAAAMRGLDAEIDVREALAAFLDERLFTIDGKSKNLWSPFSGDYRTADGWVRLHCNFDHHRDAVFEALGTEEIGAACASRTSLEIERAVTEAGGCAAALKTPEEWRRDPRSRAVAGLPLVRMRRVGEGPARRRETPRVLDLTRVIAGPVATRTLAAYGADVLKVGMPGLPEVDGLVISTAFGKRSCHLDPGDGAFARLVEQADVVVRAVRPGALGVVDEVARRTPGLIVVDITAYGPAGGRGFDSLVQMATGLAWGDPPRPLPAQVLDHATGYLAAFGAMAALLRRQEEGGSWRVELSLARTAQWLAELSQTGTTRPEVERGEAGAVPVSGGGSGQAGRARQGGERGEAGTAGELEPTAKARLGDERRVGTVPPIGEPAQVAEEPKPSGESAKGVDVSGLMGEMDSAFGRLGYVLPPGRVGGWRPGWGTAPPRQGEHAPEWLTYPS